MKNKETINLDIPLYYINYWKSSFEKLPRNRTYILVLDYPLSNPGNFKIHTGSKGCNLTRLIKEIGKAYNKVYASAKKSNKYGVWGHDIGDLALEGIYIDHKKRQITLAMGS